MSGTMPAEVLLTGMLYLIGITDNDESEIFKLCLDFWLHFSNTLYDAEKAFVSANPVVGVPCMCVFVCVPMYVVYHVVRVCSCWPFRPLKSGRHAKNCT